MTTPKVSTIKRGDSRFYISPDDGSIKAPGVTSIINMFPKPFLQFWAAKVVAEEAVDNFGGLAAILTGPAGKPAAVDWLKGAPRRVTGKAADVGTDAHGLFETMAKGKSPGRVHPDLEPFVRHFGEFLDKAQPEYVFLEETVWSDKHLYAGSFDAYAIIQGEKVWIDNKTTRSGIHEEVGIQLAAYRYADSIIRADGSRVPMPKADGAAVVHVRPEGWQFTPVRADEAMFDVFLHLRAIFDFEKEQKRTVIGQPLLSGPEDAEEVTGPKRRTPRAKAVTA